MEINGQMTIFDFLEPAEDPELDVLPELHEAARRVNEKFGIKLIAVFDGYFRRVVYKSTVKTKEGKAEVEMTEDNYNESVCNGRRYISVDFEWKKPYYHGSSCPCDNLKQIFGKFERNLL